MTIAATMKQCCMDLKLTQHQHASYEKVVAHKDQTFSQRSTSKLDEAASRDIEEANATKLAGEAFDSFCWMLDEPMPKAARELLAREEIWG